MTTQLAIDLSAAKALIDTPEKWTQGAGARNARGVSVSHASDAVCFCSAIACKVVVGEYQFAWPMFETLRQAIPEGSAAYTVVKYNDHPDTTHDDVMDLFDRAIAAAEEGA